LTNLFRIIFYLMNLLKAFLASATLLLGTIITASAQNDIEPVLVRNKYGESEEFNVLKADKKVRQGAYAKYRIVPGPRNEIAMQETGSYERGQKEGEWRTFFDGRLFNRLSSKGSYHAGLPDGQWVYYHRPAPHAPSKLVFTGKNPKEGLAVDLDDTLAVVRAKGLCYRGAKVGLWKYYDEQKVLVQAVNESTQQLMYWQPTGGQPISGEEMAVNHPLLYAGGRPQLLHDIIEAVNVKALIGTGETIMKTGLISTTELVISIDSLGHQTGIVLATGALPDKYEQFIIGEMNKVPTHWFPKVVNGKAVTSRCHLLIMADKPKKDEVHVSAKAMID
jgi:antitoxin component YwqK of YwqJK toxin-antitoxin module